MDIRALLKPSTSPSSTCLDPIWDLCMLFRKQQHTYKLIAAWLCSKHYIGQRFSKSGLWSASGLGGNSIRTRHHFVFQTHSYHSDLHMVCVAHTHTHTHTHGCMDQCCSVYRLFCSCFQTKHIATSDILDKP